MKVRDTPGSGPGNGATRHEAGSVAAGSAASPPGAGTTLGAGRPPGTPGGLRVEPPGPSTRRRIPELVLGIFLVAGCALGAVLVMAASRERTPVLTLAGDIERGHVLEQADLKVVYMGSDNPIAYVRQGDEGQLLGLAALADLGEGTILTPRQFAEPQQITQSGDGVVGFDLELGQLPTRRLAAGDLVTVVAGQGLTGEEPEVVVEAAIVVEVEKVQDSAGQSERWWISLKADEQDAEALAMATVGDNPVQLIQVRR